MKNKLDTHQLNHWWPEESGGGVIQGEGNSLGCWKCSLSSLRWWLRGVVHSPKFIKLLTSTVHVLSYIIMLQ